MTTKQEAAQELARTARQDADEAYLMYMSSDRMSVDWDRVVDAETRAIQAETESFLIDSFLLRDGDYE